VLGPCTLRNPEAEAKAEAESRRGPRLLRAESSDPHINRVFTVSGTYSPCGGNARGSQTHGLAYVGANPRPQCRTPTTRFFGRMHRPGGAKRTQPTSDPHRGRHPPARRDASSPPLIADGIRRLAGMELRLLRRFLHQGRNFTRAVAPKAPMRRGHPPMPTGQDTKLRTYRLLRGPGAPVRPPSEAHGSGDGPFGQRLKRRLFGSS
jgi:hypothetical protein